MNINVGMADTLYFAATIDYNDLCWHATNEWIKIKEQFKKESSELGMYVCGDCQQSVIHFSVPSAHSSTSTFTNMTLGMFSDISWN